MRAIHATHSYDNTDSDSGGKLIIDASMSTEEGVSVGRVAEDGSEAGWEVAPGIKGEVSWNVGLPLIGGAGSKINPEIGYKYGNKTIEKEVKSEDDRASWAVSGSQVFKFD